MPRSIGQLLEFLRSIRFDGRHPRRADDESCAAEPVMPRARSCAHTRMLSDDAAGWVRGVSRRSLRLPTEGIANLREESAFFLFCGFVAKLDGELAEQIALLIVQFGWHDNLGHHDLIATPVATQIWNAFAAQTEQLAFLRARRNFKFRLPLPALASLASRQALPGRC